MWRVRMDQNLNFTVWSDFRINFLNSDNLIDKQSLYDQICMAQFNNQPLVSHHSATIIKTPTIQMSYGQRAKMNLKSKFSMK